MTRDPMQLHLRGVSRTYPNGVRALNDVSLTIPVGMFGLLGPNGAGKSTLMRMIATLQEPDSGTIRLGDVDVLKQKDEVRRTLGYLPQEFGVYPTVSSPRRRSGASSCDRQCGQAAERAIRRRLSPPDSVPVRGRSSSRRPA